MKTYKIRAQEFTELGFQGNGYFYLKQGNSVVRFNNQTARGFIAIIQQMIDDHQAGVSGDGCGSEDGGGK